MSVPPVKAEVKVGERGTEKLIDAVVDTFSPATETLGLIGDAVRLARVEVAAHVTKKAKAIADGSGVKLSAPPLKFLVPFFEKASTEHLNNTSLVEMWAHLLANAGASYNDKQMRYVSILSELGSNQAEILDKIVRNFGGVLGENADPDQLIYALIEPRLVSKLKSIQAYEPEEIIEAVLKEVAFPGTSIVIIQGETKSDSLIFEWDNDNIYCDEKSLEFEILVSMGLLAKVETDFVEVANAEITVIMYRVTELGFDFWRACTAVVDK